MSYKAHMNGGGKSYSGVIPAKQLNKSGRPPAEVVEGRPQTERTWTNLTWAEYRVGKAGQTGWTVCGKLQEGTRSYGSPLYYTM